MTSERAEQTSRHSTERPPAARPVTWCAPAADGQPVLVDPDLDFIRALSRQGGTSLKKCFQCGTCSATCTLAPDAAPFPRKEMAWAAWGMKQRLLADPDVWLCYQCNDCSTRCPRGAHPGEVLGAVRQECVLHYAVPRFLGRWVNQPHGIPLLLGIPAALLTLALVVRAPIEDALGISRDTGQTILYAYSSKFPHWLLNSFFGLFSLLVLVAMLTGVVRFWRALQAAATQAGIRAPTKGLVPSIMVTLGRALGHKDFSECTTAHSRLVSHVCVFFGFLALTLVTLWVITAPYNPLIQDGLVYPFGFWSPWKILANLGGAALVVGCLMMIRDRLTSSAQVGTGSYFDWALISTLLLVVITGFVAELLHYLRLEPHRHIAYFIHLVFVFVVLMYLPYSKLAHLVYRATAMVFAEHYGRGRAAAAHLAGTRQAG